jgi:AcrR family transcriptional regulator
VATTSSLDRRARRRALTIDEALDHAVVIMTERGVGGLTVSEIARRMGVRGPSLYKYFPSLHAVYDALFARGVEAQRRAVAAATEGVEPGIATIRAVGRALVAWCVTNPALAQLLFWRPVPGFEPSPEAFAGSERAMEDAVAVLTGAVRRGELTAAAAGAEGVRLLTVVISGIVTQQMANEPGVGVEDGAFTRLTDDALDMYLERYRPKGADHADA